MTVLDRQGGLRHVVDRRRGLSPAAGVIHRCRARHDGEPGRQAGAGRIVGLEQAKVVGAQAHEDVLGGIHDIVFAQPIGRERSADNGADEGRGRDNERVPRPLAARRQCPQVDLVQFRHACVSVLRPSAQQFIRVCGEMRPRYSRRETKRSVMSESLTRQQKITKQAVRGKGVVVAQNCRAAEVGAEILRKGGNAIDAAVATGMAIGTLEPWMSGIGGVGFMTIWSAKEGRAWTVDYGPISAGKLDPANYRIVGPGPANPFAWPDILEQRNEVGYHSIAVPGQVAGLATALERFGTLKWAEVLAPGIALAERGMELDWYMQVMIANGAEHLAKFPASRAAYLPDAGRVPKNDWQGTRRYLKLGNLAETMRRL